jgi:hypothetical protein
MYRVRRYFSLDSGHLFRALRRKKLGQADLVMALMKIGTDAARRITECLIGRSIAIGPACLLKWSHNTERPTIGRQPVITRVIAHRPKIKARSRLAQVFDEFRVGRTRAQLLSRGVSRGDIRRAQKRGWIQLAT